MFFDKVGLIKVMVDGNTVTEFDVGHILLCLKWERPGGPLILPVPGEQPITLEEWKTTRQLVRHTNGLD